METSLDVADIEVNTYVLQSALEEVTQTTKSNVMLRYIIEFIVNAWPETDVVFSEDPHLYYSLRDELTYHPGCIVKGNRVIVPEALRETIPQRLHRVCNQTPCLGNHGPSWVPTFFTKMGKFT